MDRHTTPSHAIVCDFCSASAPDIRSLDAAPLSLSVNATTIYFCDSKWAACPICSQLIDEGRWEELTDRSYTLWLEAESRSGNKPGFVQRQFMRTHISELHRLFREARRRTA